MTISNAFSAVETLVSISFDLQPRFNDAAPTFPTDATVAFYTWNGGDPFLGADWKIDSDEVGWVIEYWLGSGEYHVEPLSPTGYAPGP